MKRWAMLLAMALLSAGTAAAQGTGTVTGTVTDATGAPVSGAAVAVQGTTRGAETGADGTKESALHHYGGLIGTSVSGGFLYLIALLNVIVLVGIVKVFLEMRRVSTTTRSSSVSSSSAA